MRLVFICKIQMKLKKNLFSSKQVTAADSCK